MIPLLFSTVLALFPERYRWRFGVSAAGAVTSGCLQLLACVIVLIYRYLLFGNHRMFGEKVVLGAAEKGGETAVMGLGLFILAEYLIQPVTLLLIYFAVEGVVRLGAGVVSGEVVPTLPLQLLALAHGRIAVAKHARDLGPPVEDLVQPGAGEFALCIASCRPKPWNQMTTISYQDKLYELAREEWAQPPRKWVYVLRKRPEGKIVRGELYQYRPDEVMPKKPADAPEPQLVD